MEELERTYIAKKLPAKLRTFPSKKMLDLYIPSTSTHPGLRVRKQGNIYQITKKRPISKGDASRQTEETILLSSDEYKELSSLEGKRIVKTRYYYKQGKTNFEIDVFHEGLEGLVLVDVEFSSVEEKDAFVMPGFCLAEVTQEKFIAGGMLCGKTYSDIQKNLNRFGYKKLNLYLLNKN